MNAATSATAGIASGFRSEIRFVRERIFGSHGMMQSGGRFERKFAIGTSTDERRDIRHRGNCLGFHAAGANLRIAPCLFHFIELCDWHLAVDRSVGVEDAFCFDGGGTRMVRVGENRESAIQFRGDSIQIHNTHHKPTEHPGMLALAIAVVVDYGSAARKRGGWKCTGIVDEVRTEGPQRGCDIRWHCRASRTSRMERLLCAIFSRGPRVVNRLPYATCDLSWDRRRSVMARENNRSVLPDLDQVLYGEDDLLDRSVVADSPPMGD